MINNKKYIVFSIIAVALLILFVILKGNSSGMTEISFNDISTSVKDNEFSLIYFGEVDKEIKEQVKKLKENYDLKYFNTELNKEELSKYSKDNNLIFIDESEGVFIIYKNEKPVSLVDKRFDLILREQLDKYLFNIIPESERLYIEDTDASNYLKSVKSNKYTIAVFGKKSCSYCNLYLPVINEVAYYHDLDIYYFDQENFSESEYNKIMDLDFEIPEKCTTTGVATSLKKGFPKPMTIITKNNKFVDCIKGYVTFDEVSTVLYKNNIIK